MLASSPNICGVQYCRLLSALPCYHITKQHFRESMPEIISIRGTIVFAFLAFFYGFTGKNRKQDNRMIAGGGGHAASVHTTYKDTASVLAKTHPLYMRGHSIYTCIYTASVNVRTQPRYLRGHSLTWDACSTSWTIGTPSRDSYFELWIYMHTWICISK